MMSCLGDSKMSPRLQHLYYLSQWRFLSPAVTSATSKEKLCTGSGHSYDVICPQHHCTITHILNWLGGYLTKADQWPCSKCLWMSHIALSVRQNWGPWETEPVREWARRSQVKLRKKEVLRSEVQVKTMKEKRLWRKEGNEWPKEEKRTGV